MAAGITSDHTSNGVWSMGGYQFEGTPEQVEKEIKSVWEKFQNKEITQISANFKDGNYHTLPVVPKAMLYACQLKGSGREAGLTIKSLDSTASAPFDKLQRLAQQQGGDKSQIDELIMKQFNKLSPDVQEKIRANLSQVCNDSSSESEMLTSIAFQAPYMPRQYHLARALEMGV
ncbi:MAG: hypothetical protein KF898_04505 [Parachlamydiales bacterium]|nr:hypothetical protein [Verrucomicrobiota bacterium]MBX3718890.1 hypothetical protein [Candidatus Acheromyda pituitae]